MRPRVIRPPWHRRLRRWTVLRHPRFARAVHRVRSTVRPRSTPLDEHVTIDARSAMLLERVQLVVTDAAIGPHVHTEVLGDGLHQVCRPFDATVNGTVYRSLRTQVRSSAAAPLSRRRRYTVATHPDSGERVLVKWIDTASAPRRLARRELHAEIAAHERLRRSGAPIPRLPHLLEVEVGRHHGALVFAHIDAPTLEDPALVLDLDRAQRVLRDVVTAMAELLDRTGLHHNDVHPNNIGVVEGAVLFDLGWASRRRREPFAHELERLTRAIGDRVDLRARDDWDALVAGLPDSEPHELLAHLARSGVLAERTALSPTDA